MKINKILVAFAGSPSSRKAKLLHIPLDCWIVFANILTLAKKLRGYVFLN